MQNRKTFVIGDIHGGYQALKQVLNRAQVTTNDQLIFLGDYVDGWSESDKVISMLIKLSKTHDCIFIRGNHDALFEAWLEKRTVNDRWLINGGNSTIKAYQCRDKSVIKTHYKFIRSLKNYYIDHQNRLFVHGGFTNLRGPKSEYYDYVFYWDRTLWETALATDKDLKREDVRYPERFKHFSEIFIGHTPVTKIGKRKPTKALNVWNIDTGAGFKGPLSMMDIDRKEIFQSNPVYTLYPQEKGRNN